MGGVTRRGFNQPGRAAATAPPNAPPARPAAAAAPGFRGTLCFFSKHLPGMDAQRLGRTVKALGFGGVDLTVRPGGHIDPKRVAQDLPPFFDALRREGIALPMITTELLSDADPAARPTFATAAALRIPYLKPGYYRYKFADARKELADAGAQFRTLVALASQSGVQLGFHNHAAYIGGGVWDIVPLIDSLDPAVAGYYFDVRHAVAEGGDGGWRSAFSVAAPRIKMIALKDFYWEKAAGVWRIKDCPLGEGMVKWKPYFAMLAQAGFHGPVSLHLEYEIPGATLDVIEANTIAAATKDLAFVKAGLAEAYR
jgi:sugar phosphate isomerase/epimerase